jgi:sugar phosphate isomerase/epimerase
MSRRNLGKLALGALSAPAMAAQKIDSVVHGIQFGLQSYIFTVTGLPQTNLVDVVIASMVESRLGECDLYAPVVEPAELWNRARATGPDAAAARTQAREELAKWRMSVPLDHYSAIRKKFDDAGIEIYGLSGFASSSDEELNRTFDIAEVMGARLITLNSTLSAAKRMAPSFEKRNLLLGIQAVFNRNATNPDAIAKPEDYAQAVSFSKNYRISFDIGDNTPSGYDLPKFIEDHHESVAMLYLKDRKKDRTSVPWGEGDTPMTQILHLIRDSSYKLRCFIDCDYKTTDRPADVKRSFAYAKAALG